MHKVELIDCQKFAHLLTTNEIDFDKIFSLLKECVITSENLKAVYPKSKKVID